MSKQHSHGKVIHQNSERKTDYLYRVSIKALVRNANGEVLVVKESGRDEWDLPGGGMDHGESIKTALARELLEEVNFQDDFQYRVLEVEEPSFLEEYGFWQLRLIFEVLPEGMSFSVGEDGDEIAFRLPGAFVGSASKTERRIYEYATKNKGSRK